MGAGPGATLQSGRAEGLLAPGSPHVAGRPAGAWYRTHEVMPGGKPPPYRGAGRRGRTTTTMGRRFWVALIALVVLAAVIVGVLEVQRHDRSR